MISVDIRNEIKAKIPPGQRRLYVISMSPSALGTLEDELAQRSTRYGDDGPDMMCKPLDRFYGVPIEESFSVKDWRLEWRGEDPEERQQNALPG